MRLEEQSCYAPAEVVVRIFGTISRQPPWRSLCSAAALTQGRARVRRKLNRKGFEMSNKHLTILGAAILGLSLFAQASGASAGVAGTRASANKAAGVILVAGGGGSGTGGDPAASNDRNWREYSYRASRSLRFRNRGVRYYDRW
jgi:hypothetical protein